MARDARARSCSLCQFIVVTDANPKGFTLGYVEQFSINQTLATELIRAVGKKKAVENVLHGIDRADISWGQTLTVPADSLQAVGAAPGENNIAAFNPIAVRLFDEDRGEIIAEVRGVLPASIGISGSAMAKIQNNFSGSGIEVVWADDLNAAA